MTFSDFIIEHYTERLAEEKRPEAKSFLRKTLNQLKKSTYDSTNVNNCFNLYHRNCITYRSAYGGRSLSNGNRN